MAADSLLKTSLLGYNRDDVLAMVDSMSAQNAQEQNQYKEAAARAEKRVAEVTRLYNDLLKRAHSIQDELVKEQQHSAQLQQQLDDLDDKYVYAQEVINTFKVEWENRQADYKSLTDAKANFDNTHANLVAENAALKEQVEALTRQVTEINRNRANIEAESSRIRLDASVEAHRLLEDAQKKAQTILDETNKAILQKQEQANRDALQYRDSLVGNARDLVVRMAVLKQRIQTVDTALREAASGLEHWCDPINQALDAAQEDVSLLGTGMLESSKAAVEGAPALPVTPEPPIREQAAEPKPQRTPAQDALEKLMLDIDRMGNN